MSNIAQPSISFRTTVRSHRTIVLAALAALLGTVAIVLVLAIGGSSGSSDTTPVSGNQPAPTVRYDGGPEEGSFAADPRPNVRYDGGPEEGLTGR